MNRATSTDMTFTGPGEPYAVAVPGADADAAWPNGSNIIRDPVSKRQYLVQVTNSVSADASGTIIFTGSKIFLLKSVLGNSTTDLPA